MRAALRSTLAVALVAVVALVTLVIGGCGTEAAVDDALERSSAPLLVPEDPWRDEFRFTAPPGSTDLYQLRWNFRPGATDVVTGWQIASTTTYDSARLAEGPGQDVVDEAMRASRGDDCEIADPDHEIQLCLYPAEFARDGVNAFLVRLVDNHILVLDYNNVGGDRTRFEPESLEARFLTSGFDAVPIDRAAADYLVYVY